MTAKDLHILRTADDVRTALKLLRSAGIPCEWSGLCIWAAPESDRDALKLHACGAKWSAKRQAWYIRGAEGIGKNIGAAAC